MNQNILTLFSGILSDVETGQYKPAACKAGQVIQVLMCEAPAAVKANATDPGAPPMTALELHGHCNQFAAQLKGKCDHNEHLVKTGASSDTQLPPGAWLAIAQLVQFVISIFVKVPIGPGPAPAPVPPAPAA